mmetsp:Transcript_7485/g.17755  ORF Transcript_7485/g.17755 Transcript_7485/m.17755 type:complete len:114 (-) Transcript_7485:66-407(-)
MQQASPLRMQLQPPMKQPLQPRGRKQQVLVRRQATQWPAIATGQQQAPRPGGGSPAEAQCTRDLPNKKASCRGWCYIAVVGPGLVQDVRERVTWQLDRGLMAGVGRTISTWPG